MYKTIIIIIIIIRRPILLGYQIAPLFHLSAALHTHVQMRIRLLLLIGNVLKTDSKTKPTSKFNCRVIIVIYKLGYVKSEKRDIF